MAGLIAHEWIAPHGGSENVAEAMGRVFPDADVVTLWNDAPERFSGHKIHETWLARSPIRKSKALALPFMSGAWRRARVDGYDFVLVSSHVFAHHIGGRRRSARSPRSFVYVHTPARTIWAPEQDNRGANPLVKLLAPAFRWLDLRAVRPDTAYAANSLYIQQRIANVWGQEATVIYPPVDVSRIRAGSERLSGGETELLAGLPAGFVLGASRFVPYKRLDLVLEAGAAAGRPVVLAGSGPTRGELEVRAAELDVTVTFVHRPSDALLRELYRRAAVFVFPAVEDFGIMPVEAMAAGTPVVVYREGGASESVELVDGGVIVDSLDAQVLAEAVQRAASKDMTAVPERVETQFGEATFRARLLAWMGTTDSGAEA
ncbi:glycosyltransferase [Curtobacterium sp. UNCCL17]|uniref:glycosyltransferase n=1 Tax=Curtobacterium sp. UNCCL17 TaxID=1449051 RepID=UPI00068FAC8B|nr:glycosyltransferase [Curtobacterium sp. UNCCL17]